jgi:peptidyl-prolyl cis-trans isomerase B (cyclophilin B)
MKTTLAAVLVLAAAATTSAIAEDVAVLDIQAGKGKPLQRVVIEFYPDDAPNTVANFEKLARKKFYNGTTFHRVFPHQMVQGGDPLSKHKDRSAVGTGGPGYTLAPEIHRKHIAGAVAAARIGDKLNPGRLSNGSQFYITLVPNPSLDGKYTVFGHVTEGMDVLDQISQVPVDTNDNPVERVEIKRVQIVPRNAIPALKQGKGTLSKIFHRIF